MKRIKEKEGKPWCKWCPEKTVRAAWRTSGVALNKHACINHLGELKKYEEKCRDDGYMSEADCQTWGRL